MDPKGTKPGLMSRTRTAIRRRRKPITIMIVGVLGVYFGSCGVLCLLHPQACFPPGISRGKLPVVFPRGFLFGTATSAHQIEGGNSNNDWWDFENQPGTIKNGDHSGTAADAWNRIPGDIALMKSIGANAYRFSIEWSRLEPQEGTYDQAAFDHYQNELRQLHAAGITPMVTLLHFTLPKWLAARGGLLAPDFPERFAAFTHQAATRLGSQATLWCTINEPNVQMYNGYIEGIWPPGEHSKEHAVQAFAALLRGHAAAAGVLHRELPGAQVGVAQHLIDFEPLSRLNLIDWYAAISAGDAFNWAFYDSIAAGRILFHATGFPSLDEPLASLAGSTDYFGMNYYRRVLVGMDLSSPSLIKYVPGPGPPTDLGWEIHPEGLLQLLRASYSRYKLPIYITENGLANGNGAARVTFLDDHLYAVAMALQEGIPVKGYCHWSLLDNFEWAEGFAPRFGLYQVDYATETRKEGLGAAEFRRLSQQILQRHDD
jgi:beta-glucosidase